MRVRLLHRPPCRSVEEIEFIIDNNSTREKTAEQKSREAKVLKEIESILAEKRKVIFGKYYREKQLNGVVPDSAQPIKEDEKGKARDTVAKKVGLKSGHEVDRAIRTVNIIDDLSDKGRTEEAELIRGVLNNGSVSSAEELAKNIDIVEISIDQNVDKSEIMGWMKAYQNARRNMSDAESIFVEKKISEARLREENEKKRLEGNALGADITNGKTVCAQMDAERNTRDRSTNTREQIAKAANVSTGTVSRYDRVVNAADSSNDEELTEINNRICSVMWI